MTEEKVNHVMALIKEYGKSERKAREDDLWDSYENRDAEKKKGEEILKGIKGILLSED